MSIRSPTTLAILASVLLLACAAVGCDSESSFVSVTSPEISVDPSSVVFGAPTSGSTTSQVSVQVRNLGKGPLVITGFEIVEEDENKEIQALDQDDWASGEKIIAAESSQTLTLQWTVLDAQIDRGQVKLTSNGGEAVITFETDDIDPILQVETEPAGQQSRQETAVRIETVPPHQ